MRTAQPDRENASLSLNFELFAVLAAIAILVVWFAVASQHFASKHQDSNSNSNHQLAPSDRFAFVRSAHASKLVASTAPAPVPALRSPPAAQFAVLQPNPRLAAGSHALAPGNSFDPLASVVFDGLPESASLSAGAKVGPQSWEIAAGDLDSIVVRLPHSNEVVHARLDLKSRSGASIRTINIEVQREPPPAVTGTVAKDRAKGATRKAKPVPAKGQRTQKKAPAKPKAQSASTTAPAPKPANATSAATASGVQKTPVVLAPKVSKTIPSQNETAATAPKPVPGSIVLPPMPTALFNPDPKDSDASGLPPAAREDPRYMTLRGLGISPANQ